MNIKDFMSALGPWIKHGVAGAAVALIIGFSADWIATAGEVDDAERDARVAAFAAVCADRGLQQWQAQGDGTKGLKGYDNREAREKLVQQFMKDHEDIKAVDDMKFDIENACEEKIEDMA